MVFANMWVEFQGSRLLEPRLLNGILLEVDGLVFLLIPVESAANRGHSPAANAGGPVQKLVRLCGGRPVGTIKSQGGGCREHAKGGCGGGHSGR